MQAHYEHTTQYEMFCTHKNIKIFAQRSTSQSNACIQLLKLSQAQLFKCLHNYKTLQHFRTDSAMNCHIHNVAQLKKNQRVETRESRKIFAILFILILPPRYSKFCNALKFSVAALEVPIKERYTCTFLHHQYNNCNFLTYFIAIINDLCIVTSSKICTSRHVLANDHMQRQLPPKLAIVPFITKLKGQRLEPLVCNELDMQYEHKTQQERKLNMNTKLNMNASSI